jgi:hypothetical protein
MQMAGLAIWGSTPDNIVNEVLACLKMRAAQFPGLPGSVSDMASWPFLTKELVHPAACEFFRRNGVGWDRRGLLDGRT